MAFFGVTIEEIDKVESIPGADRIQKASLKGMSFEFVIGKDSFKSNDKVLYFPVDSLIPLSVQEKLGVAGKLSGSKKERVKTIKLRGTLSQGLVGSLDLIKDMPKQEGIDEPTAITEFLGITKYEVPEIPCKNANLRRLPCGLTIYDIEGADRYKNILDMLMEQEVVITEKMEGCLEYNTEIDTLEFGKKKIGDIVENKIYCHVKTVENDEIVYKSIIEFSVKEEVDDWYEIITQNGKRITVTGNHYVFLPKLKCWRKVKDITENDYFLTD
jgi:RNA ligase (TIGR02306 family)